MSEILVETTEYEEREAEFGESDAGKRLDAALAERFPDLSRTRIQHIIESGLVRPEGLDKNSRVKSGDIIHITVNERKPLSALPESIELDIVYEDSGVVVVNKARGMVVHPAKGNLSGTLVNALLGRYEGAGGFSASSGTDLQGLRPGIVHRIDKNTSGLLVVAKNDAAHEGLAAQFAAHTVTRQYTAIVLGGFAEKSGTIDAPIGRDPKNRQRQAVVHDGGKSAVTHFRLIERLTGGDGVYSLLELRLETGRTHQIRVHMAYIGHPVLGDDVYGAARGLAAGEGQYLHAGVLGFTHPVTGERMLFESSLPEYFEGMLNKLK